ncbi:hypothetical protein ARSEF1564_009039 [Beauveria bassiana]
MTFYQNSRIAYDSLAMLGLIAAPYSRSTTQDEAEPLVNGNDTESTTLYAAWALVVSRMTKSNRVVFGVADWQHQATRPGGDVDLNVLTTPIYINTDGHQTIQDYLAHMQDQQNKAASAVVDGLNKSGSDVGSRLAPSTLISVQPEKSTLIEVITTPDDFEHIWD